ncbi:RluA family pseudouridine synthase [Paenibacillus aurantius]|uniref:Pseudouridine synthase n=1 Tax=Paenibacillus aurantius TaxID=2918900 RepID=A0AA96RCB8_9BACL|nr:RluA family pseudouridine synthase [Paenibacillus aurantius]WNQ10360.1 RluA family pseudouridine synthase [Paenibacillus aurantius]
MKRDPRPKNQTTGHSRNKPAAKTGQAGKTAPKARTYPVAQEGELLAFLLEHVTGSGRNAIKAMLARGQVSVDGRAQTAYNHPLTPGQTVTVSKERIDDAPPFMGLAILHEDEHLIVIRKEAGLLSIAARHEENEITAYNQLMEHVKRAHPKNRIFVVHRLDRDTSGVMMFAKSEEVQQALQTAWRESVEERVYTALVEGIVRKPEGTVSSWLKESKTLRMYSSPYAGDGQHAVTHYKVLQSGNGFSLLEVRLETGRKNQIRVHMQDIGHPIVGDKKYGARSSAIGRLGLHARVLAFLHPVTGERLRFRTDIPKPFLKVFQEGNG